MPMLKEGICTPWGRADATEVLAPGIEFAGTPSHGGVKLSDERLAAMPADQRTRDGWYEEDCEAAFPLHHFRNELSAREIERNGRWLATIQRMYGGDFSKCRMPHH